MRSQHHLLKQQRLTCSNSRSSPAQTTETYLLKQQRDSTAQTAETHLLEPQRLTFPTAERGTPAQTAEAHLLDGLTCSDSRSSPDQTAPTTHSLANPGHLPSMVTQSNTSCACLKWCSTQGNLKSNHFLCSSRVIPGTMDTRNYHCLGKSWAPLNPPVLKKQNPPRVMFHRSGQSREQWALPLRGQSKAWARLKPMNTQNNHFCPPWALFNPM